MTELHLRGYKWETMLPWDGKFWVQCSPSQAAQLVVSKLRFVSILALSQLIFDSMGYLNPFFGFSNNAFYCFYTQLHSRWVVKPPIPIGVIRNVELMMTLSNISGVQLLVGFKKNGPYAKIMSAERNRGGKHGIISQCCFQMASWSKW